MVENLVLVRFPKEAGVYIFSSNDEVIYVGSSKNLYNRMMEHRSCIRKGWDHGYKQDLYQYLQSSPFTVEFQLTDNYRQLEQELTEKYNPKYNANRAYTGLGALKGRVTEYKKEWYQKYKKEILGQKKEYNNQLCCYNGETLTLDALSKRFKRQGIDHPVIEAKKYLIL